MNVAIILSGGVGSRFGSKIPKQYLDLCGKPVINHVMEAAFSSEAIDEIVLVIDKEYLPLVNTEGDKKVHIVSNGKERVYSVKNALDYINDKLPNCENIIILQAVSPFITPNLIEKYFESLNIYDVVTTAERCVGELFNVKKYEKINRQDYYFCQSPEAFKFKDLYECLDVNSPYTELIYHYKTEPKIYYYFDFENNIKLTYKADLDYANFLMKSLNSQK